jgi:hypothetical protein
VEQKQKRKPANSARAGAQPRRGGQRRPPDDSSGIEAYHRTTAGGLALILLLLSSIAAGMYASVLNTSTWFSLYVVSGTVVGLVTGVGVALLGASSFLLITGKAGRSYLKRAQIKKKFMLLYHGRNFLLSISEDKLRLVSVVIIASMAPAYWIARPLYVFSGFAGRLPQYLALAQATPPQDFLAEHDRREKEEAHDPAAQPPSGSDDDAPEQPHFGNASAPVDTHGQGEVQKPAPHQAKLAGPNHLPVTGKILPIDLARHAIDPVYFDLSGDRRPRRPDEVGAIAALWWSKEEVGSYSGSGEAFQQHCTVMVWDQRTKSLLAERSFVGGMPPRWSSHGFPQSGSRPYQAISAFLNGLPHR